MLTLFQEKRKKEKRLSGLPYSNAHFAARRQRDKAKNEKRENGFFQFFVKKIRKKSIEKPLLMNFLWSNIIIGGKPPKVKLLKAIRKIGKTDGMVSREESYGYQKP